MYSYFSDLHVDLLAQALLQPGEQRIGQTVGRHAPWYAMGFVNETYLVIATDRRLVLIEHRMAWLHQAVKLHSVESIPWQSVQEARMAGIFGKKLVVRGQAQNRAFARKLRIPNRLFGLLAPLRNNVGGARAVAAGFQASRGLLQGAPAYAPLAPASYAVAPALPAHPQAILQTPQAAYAPGGSQGLAQPTQPADYAQPYAQPAAPAYAQPQVLQPPPLPAFNAPGYASVPPAAAAPSRGIAPTAPRAPAGPRPGEG